MINKNDIDFIAIENQSCAFPKHFHETFCISLIRSGIEKIDFESSFLYSGGNSISITNPFEVHSNPIVDKDVKVSFDTIYISEDLMKYALNGSSIEFKNRQIRDYHVINSFTEALVRLKSEAQDAEHAIAELISHLFPYAQNSESKNAFKSDYLHALIEYIENNIDNKIYLDELAKIARINKFGFSKKFKSLTGMPPMSYVLMKKIFSAKDKLNADKDICITELAYDYNFTDISHFSQAFKKFVGVSPKIYQKQL